MLSAKTEIDDRADESWFEYVHISGWCRHVGNYSRNSKKGFALLQGNKVRKACLRIPLVYSYRTQRLPPVSTCNTRTEDKNDNSMIIVGVDKGKVEVVNTEVSKRN